MVAISVPWVRRRVDQSMYHRYYTQQSRRSSAYLSGFRTRGTGRSLRDLFPSDASGTRCFINMSSGWRRNTKVLSIFSNKPIELQCVVWARFSRDTKFWTIMWITGQRQPVSTWNCKKVAESRQAFFAIFELFVVAKVKTLIFFTTSDLILSQFNVIRAKGRSTASERPSRVQFRHDASLSLRGTVGRTFTRISRRCGM